MMRRLLYMILLFALVVPTAGAQKRKVQNKPYMDMRRFHYGFFVGGHDQAVKFRNNGYIDPTTGEQWVVNCDQQNIGFNVGVLGEWRLNKTFALRLQPSLYFGSKHLRFKNLTDGGRETQDMKSCYVGTPLDVKIAAPRFNNYRPYFVMGPSFYYDLTAIKHSNLRTKPVNIFLEVGAGVDLYMPFFKFIPELKFCLGLNNVLKKNRPDLTDATKQVFSQSVDKATVGMVVLTFYFE